MRVMKDVAAAVRNSAPKVRGSSVAEAHHERPLLKLLAMSRYSIGIAVAGTFLGATALLMYGVLETHALVRAVIGVWLSGVGHSSDPPPLLAAMAAVHSFLVAVVLYFIAAGLYQLFFHPLPLPEWLVVEDLHDLEDQLAQVVVVVLGIAFLGQAVTWDGQRDVLGFGVATALVIVALSLHLRRVRPTRTPEDEDAS
jgi:uncharacterized membrane protein YqhA